MGLLDYFRILFGEGEAKAAWYGPVCVACGTGDLTVIGPDAFYCNVCGYEGGKGYPALIKERQKAALRSHSVEELLERVVALVKSAGFSKLGARGPSKAISDALEYQHRKRLGYEYGPSHGASPEELASLRMERDRLRLQAEADLKQLRLVLDVLGELEQPVEHYVEQLEAAGKIGESGKAVIRNALNSVEVEDNDVC